MVPLVSPFGDEATRLRVSRPIEDDILAQTGNRVERVLFFGSDGRVLLSRDGGADQVLFTASELAGLIGTVDLITHNHPRGTSLTPEDLTLALFLNAREVHAFTTRARYRLFRTGPQWPEPAHVHAVLRVVEGPLIQEVSVHLRNGRLTDRQAEMLYYRVMWERFTRHFSGALGYVQERR
jgi:hypothetical protein